MVNRKDFRPYDSKSTRISDKDRTIIRSSENTSVKFTPSQQSDVLKHPKENKYYVRTTDTKGNLVFAMNVNSMTSTPYYMSKTEAKRLQTDLAKPKGATYSGKPYTKEYQYTKEQTGDTKAEEMRNDVKDKSDKKDYSSSYKKAFKDAYNNPSQYSNIKLSTEPSNKKVADYKNGAVSGVIARQQDDSNGKTNFILNEKDLNEKIR